MGQAVAKLAHTEPDREDRDIASDPFRLRDDALLRYAEQLERDHPGYLASLGMTAAEYAREMAAPAQSLEASVEAGALSAAEARFLRGEASLDDLLALGHAPDEARALLAEQQACASSG